MPLNVTNFAAALKEYYSYDRLRNMVYKNNPFLAMVPKDPNAAGKKIPVPIQYADTTGRSATFGDALSNKGNSSHIAFELEVVSDYAIGSISRQAMLASRKDTGAFAQATKVEVDSTINAVARSLAKQLYRNANGWLARIGSVTAANPMVITLSNVYDITNFEVGMVLEASATEIATGLETTPATVSIAAINRSAGTITTAFDNSGSTTDWSANDYLFVEGDIENMLSGLSDWIPDTAPTSTAFFGVNRSVDVTRLGGVRHTGTSQTVEEAFLDIASKVGVEGGRPDCGVTNNFHYRNLLKSLGAQVEYVKQGVTAEVYFSGVRIHGGPVPITVYQDFNCPAGRAYVLQKDTWKLHSFDEAPHLFDADDPQKMLREASADAYELRAGYYAQLGCDAPGWNGVTTLATS